MMCVHTRVGGRVVELSGLVAMALACRIGVFLIRMFRRCAAFHAGFANAIARR